MLVEIDSVLSGKVQFTDVGADIMGLAYIQAETTKLMGSDVDNSNVEIPTIAFRQIALEWLNFLETHGK